MPLLHRETSGGGGGSQENRRSLAEILDTSQLAGDAAAPTPNLANGSSSAWRWEPPGSPEAAQSPRALVPAACFPPRDHPAALASLSELAAPGSWANEPAEGIADLVESFKALGAPPQVPLRSASVQKRSSIQTRLSCELTLDQSWPSERAFAQAQETCRDVVRRASFCGAADAPRHELLTWKGVLPQRCMDANPPGGFSSKVFMGGLPWDIGDDTLMYALREFQPMSVEWPSRDTAPRGFAYVTLENERRVRALLHASRREGGKWIYRVPSRNMRTKDVEVIPWAVADSNWVCPAGGGGSVRLESRRTVFVGALHGVMTAFALGNIMSDLFSGVVYAGIDTDKDKYPIGSGRVTFNNVRSYVRALCAEFVEIRTDKFSKKVQVDPYLEDAMCSVCNLQQGPYFCREPVCFNYFCRACWAWQHPSENHRMIMRNSKNMYNGNVYSNGNGSSRNGNGSYRNGNGSYSNGNGSYGNGNGGYGNGNSYSNGNSGYSLGNGNSNSNAGYNNGNSNAGYNNGNGSYINGSYSNGNGYSNNGGYGNGGYSSSNDNGSSSSNGSNGLRQSASEPSRSSGSFTQANATPSSSTSGGSADCVSDEQAALGWSSLEP